LCEFVRLIQKKIPSRLSCSLDQRPIEGVATVALFVHSHVTDWRFPTSPREQRCIRPLGFAEKRIELSADLRYSKDCLLKRNLNQTSEWL